MEESDGVLYQGRRGAEGVMTDVCPMLCDFCSAENPIYEYDCTDFVTVQALPGLAGAVSEGGWLACRECAAFIDAGDLDGLIERCWQIHKAMYPFMPDAVKENLVYGHRRFFEHRKGRKSITQ
jgi:hypothetical protein